MKGWFIGTGGLPMIKLEAVTVVEPGNDGDRSVAYVGGKEFRTEVGSVDVARFLQEFRDFRTGPAVEPENPTAIDPRKIGKLDRMPTVEEVNAHNGKWRWYPVKWMGGRKDIMLWTSKTGIQWKPFANVGYFLFMDSWSDGDSIEPITEGV